MKQVTLCVFGNGYTESYNCEVDLDTEDRMLIPTIGDEIMLPGMKVSQVVRSRSFNYSERRILVVFNNPESSASGTVEGK